MIYDFWLASPFPRSQLFEPTSNRFDNSQSSPSNTSLHHRQSQAKVIVLPPLILPQHHRKQHSFMNSNWNFQNEFEKDFDYEGWFNNVTAPSWNFDVESNVDNYWNCNDVEEMGNINSRYVFLSFSYSKVIWIAVRGTEIYVTVPLVWKSQYQPTIEQKKPVHLHLHLQSPSTKMFQFSITSTHSTVYHLQQILAQKYRKLTILNIRLQVCRILHSKLIVHHRVTSK